MTDYLIRKRVAISGSLTKTAFCIRNERTSHRNRASMLSRRSMYSDGRRLPMAISEANAEDLIYWIDGRALVATGSPFAPVSYNGRRIPITQCNNIYIFPAIGLGVVASGARRVMDTMIFIVVCALVENSPALH